MTRFLVVAFLFLAGLPAGVQGEAGAAAYLSDAVQARWQSMGGAGRAAASDIGAIYLNPACLSNQGPILWQVGTAYGFATLGRSTFSLASLRQTDRYGTYAVGWFRNEVKELERVDSTGKVIGLDSNAEDALTVAFGIPLLYRLRVGAAVKYLHQTLFDLSASGGALDIGALAQPWLAREFFIGLTVESLFGVFKWDTGRQDRPARAIAGGTAYRWREKALLAVDLVSREGAERLEYHAGVEYWVLPEIAIRAGLDDGWIAVGAGYSWRIYELDYAFALNDSELGDVHRFSFILRL